MDSKSLMIGDWVYEGRNHPIKVKHNYGRSIRYDEGDYSHEVEESCLCPIHLTAEILEKNGWEDKWWWDLPECPFSLVKYCENSWADGKWGVMFHSEDNSPSFLIGGIHELQHLLRLCELNDLADAIII